MQAIFHASIRRVLAGKLMPVLKSLQGLPRRDGHNPHPRFLARPRPRWHRFSQLDTPVARLSFGMHVLARQIANNRYGYCTFACAHLSSSRQGASKLGAALGLHYCCCFVAKTGYHRASLKKTGVAPVGQIKHLHLHRVFFGAGVQFRVSGRVAQFSGVFFKPFL